MISTAIKKFISAYHTLISPWLGNRCRFYPTCSDYSIQALDEHGVCKGLYLTTKRICRCHPWGGEGHDPVPHCVQNSKHTKQSKNRHTSNLNQYQEH